MSDLSLGFNIARFLQGQTLGFTIFEIRLTDFRWFIQNEPKLAPASLFHTSSWLISFDE